MKLKNQELEIKREDLIYMIENENPDKKDWSKKELTDMVKRFRSFSVKQSNWILKKVQFIVNHNNKYINYRKKFKSIVII